MQLPDQRTVAITAILFSAAFATTFIAVSELSQPKGPYSEDISFEVNASTGIATTMIDGKNLSMMHQDTAEGKFFIDVTNDQQPDREISITRDGEAHRKRIFATLEGQTYSLTIEYQDNPEVSGDAYLKITRAEALK